eukprot:6124145-Pleurochrysis_carterae.AAC.4
MRRIEPIKGSKLKHITLSRNCRKSPVPGHSQSCLNGITAAHAFNLASTLNLAWPIPARSTEAEREQNGRKKSVASQVSPSSCPVRLRAQWRGGARQLPRRGRSARPP